MKAIKLTKKRTLIIVGALAFIVVLYLGLALMVADRTPAHATLSNIDVSGLSSQQAREKLVEETKDALQPIPVSLPGGKDGGQIDPQSAQLSIDYDASIKKITGFTLHPQQLWDRLRGTVEDKLVMSFDEKNITSQVHALNDKLAVEPQNATLSFEGTKIITTEAKDGTSINEKKAQQYIVDNWVKGERPLKLPALATHPEISDEDIALINKEQATVLVSGPVTVKVGDKDVQLTPEELAGAASLQTDGEVKLVVDEGALVDKVKEKAKDQLPAPVNAKIQMDGHRAPIIIDSVSGKTISEEAVGQDITQAAFSNERSVTAEVTVQEPELTTQKAQELGVKEVVSEIETPLTADSVRTQNLLVGTAKTNNALILPGQEFSLLSYLNPMTAANGYVSSGVVIQGAAAKSLGGGLSQLSTNTFNLGYRAGMEDIQHTPHSKYFSRYPMGVESTVWSPNLDMKWKNTTPYAVLVETWVADGKVKSRLWSTKYYDVSINVSQPYAYTSAGVKESSAANCLPSPAGGPGFTVDVHRVVTREGKTVYDNKYTWTYEPMHATRCV